MTGIIPVQSRTVYKWTTGREREHTGETPEMKRKREERNKKARERRANRTEEQKEADSASRRKYRARKKAEETSVERQQKKDTDAARKISLKNEKEDRMQKLLKAAKEKERKGQETTAQREERLRKDRERYTEKKRQQKEKEEEAERFILHVERERQRRILEEEEARRERQFLDSQTHDAEGILENPEEQTFRKAVDAERHGEALLLEGDEVRTQILYDQAEGETLRRLLEEDELREWMEERERESMETIAERDARRARETARARARRLAEPDSVRLERNRRSRQARADNVPATHQLALSPIESEDAVPSHFCGPMDQTCSHCNANHFSAERPTQGQFSVCCQKGRVTLVSLGEGFTGPNFARLRALLSHEGSPREISESKHFLEKIRQYNNGLAFAAKDCRLRNLPRNGPQTYVVHGQVYHSVPPIHPEQFTRQRERESAASEGQPQPEEPQNRPYIPTYNSLYILDSEQALNFRMAIPSNGQCRRQLFNELEHLLQDHNPFAQTYKNLKTVEEEESVRAQVENRPPNIFNLTFHLPKDLDSRRYNAPTAQEIAAVFTSPDGTPPVSNCIAYLNIPLAGKYKKKIHQTNPFCDPMTYPLFHPTGILGWHTNLLLNPDLNPRSHNPRKAERVTLKQYYCYQMSARRDSFNPILRGRALAQQYLVDAYCKIESERLSFLRENQKKLRAERYSGLRDYLHNIAEHEGARVGTVVILPSNYTGGPRAMKQNYQDAMAIVAHEGTPSLFITMTCNPEWPEIQKELLSGQKWPDRPDLVARVFKIKLDALVKEINSGHIFGKILGEVGVIEFQKRGLPHAHLLYILDKESDPFDTPERIDSCVSAEIPDPEENLRLHELVMKMMIHGPCKDKPNLPCREDGECSKKFPKDFLEETQPNVGGYPLYRRRDTGIKYLKKGNRHRLPPREGETQGVLVSDYVDNRDVVPYNPYLLLRYECHINVEICSSIAAVKYLFKYVYKGHDCAVFKIDRVERVGSSGRTETVHNWDEISSYLDTRYVSAPEAVWRILGFPMQLKSHAVYRLPVHLPEDQILYFQCEHDDNQETVARSTLEKAKNTETPLSSFFNLNKDYPPARIFFYRDIPKHFVFNKATRLWTPRVRYRVIGRLYSVSPRETERFALSLLLNHVKGPTSFEDLRTVDNVVYDSFKEAAIVRGLLRSDLAWENTMREAIVHQMPNELRQLFSIICVFGEPTDAFSLYDRYKTHMVEDFVRRGYSEEASEALLLKALHDLFVIHGKTNVDYNLPLPDDQILSNLPQLARERVLHNEEQVSRARTEGEARLAQLNEDQTLAFQQIMQAIGETGDRQRCFFLDGPGGTGKTFVYNTLANVLIGQGKSVICVASTGIAATLLIPLGRTFHSQFKLFPPIDETTTSKIRDTSLDAKQIREASLIIWDEATMTTKHALNAVDILLREIMRKPNTPFGGKVMLLGGDFRQCLPVVKHGGRVKIVEDTIKMCPTWPGFKQLRLTRNMRAAGDPEYSSWLMDLGDGKLTNQNGLGEDVFKVPDDLLSTTPTVEGLIQSTFGGDLSPQSILANPHRAILCPKNKECLLINNLIIDQIPEPAMESLSVDSIVSDDPEEIANFPVPFLNTLNTSGLPPHKLTLKVGAIIMIIRNLNTAAGLCNGTRLFVRDLSPNLIVAQVLTGKAAGKVVFIPKLSIIPTDTDFPFKLSRTQFPVIPSFAITITKSQGQTLEKVGIFLTDPVFSHGQLYVACSRCPTKEGVKMVVLDSERHGKILENSQHVFTYNIVFKEIFEM